MKSEVALVECCGLACGYGRHIVLSDVSFAIGAGEVVGVVGENGSGKSTLLNTLLGYLPVKAGWRTVTRKSGYCPQTDVLNSQITVAEHLALITALYARRWALDQAFIAELLEIYDIEKWMDRQVRKLSGGSRQKVQLVLSLLHKPNLLFLDEPYDGFDWRSYLAFWNMVERLAARGTSVLLVTHMVHDRTRFNRLIELQDGAAREI